MSTHRTGLLETPEERAFRSRARAWLRANVPPALKSSASPSVADRRAWEAILADAGYAAIHWPREYGGAGGSLVLNAIFEEEYLAAGAPDRINVIGLRLVGPTLMEWGTAEQQARWLPGILRCDTLWSQGFSEPEAGSDLSGLRTRATVADDVLRVTGQKTWTTFGPWADWIFLLVRTSDGARRHDGLTFVMVDMSSPGIEVRPIRQVNGDAGFAEVFFDDVAVPSSNVVGEVGQGWRVAMSTLAAERGAGTISHALLEQDLAAAVAIARDRGMLDDDLVRCRLAELYAEVQLYRYNSRQTLRQMDAGVDTGAEASLNKLLWSETRKRIYKAGLDLLGAEAEAAPQDTARTVWHREYWYSRAATIYGGTSEIQRNIVAERLLGLPR